ncbi:MAG: HNH endonuclease [Chloroflexota bacterium]|nr:HNH endonuclease [Chloroflexota bacterium]
MVGTQGARKDARRAFDGECAVCGSADRPRGHHIEPIASGGSNEADNLVCLCSKCHGAMEGALSTGHFSHLGVITAAVSLERLPLLRSLFRRGITAKQRAGAFHPEWPGVEVVECSLCLRFWVVMPGCDQGRRCGCRPARAADPRPARMARLMDASEAARLLALSDRTVRDRAKRAYSAGDARLSRVGDRWVATEGVWRALCQQMPKPRGNPRKPPSATS